MGENEQEKMTSISKAQAPEEIGEFWDNHSLADYWDQTKDVQVEVRAKHRRRVRLDPDIYARIEAEARTRGVLPETLVNVWLAERLAHGV